MISGALLLDAEVQVHAAVRRLDLAAPSTALRATLGTYGSFARFFNSAIARAARRPSLVAVESSCLAWSVRPASNAVSQRRKRAS